MDDDYVKELEETVRKFATPLNDVPFRVVIKALSGHAVLPFDENNQRNIELLEILRCSCDEAMRTAHAEGIDSGRVNEVGNKIESFVKDALNNNDVTAGTPNKSGGKKMASAYPDILIEEPDGRKTYLECKTYSLKNIDTTFRSFYFKASETSKITYDAMHLMVSFEMEKAQRNNADVYIPVSWKIYNLERLLVQMKSEFNASNRDMYGTNGLPLLAQGRM